MSLLGDRLLAVHAALDTADIPHAIGGAIALAYCTAEPRATRDLDVNVFVEVSAATKVLDALPAGVQWSAADLAVIVRDGQVRLWWEDTPVDLFFDVSDFHVEVPLTVRQVPFEGQHIPVLGCDELVVFKAMFNRTKDWADIEAMVETGSVDMVSASEGRCSAHEGVTPASQWNATQRVTFGH